MTENGKKEKQETKNSGGANSTDTLVTIAVPAVVCAVTAPFIASAALSTTIIGGLAGAAIGIGYILGGNNKKAMD